MRRKRRIIPGLDHGRPMPSWAGLSSPNLVAALPIKYICMGVARAFGGASFRAGGSTGTALSGHQTIYIFLKMRHDTLVELLLGISACLHKIHISKSGVWRPTRAPVVTDRCERVA